MKQWNEGGEARRKRERRGGGRGRWPQTQRFIELIFTYFHLISDGGFGNFRLAFVIFDREERSGSEFAPVNGFLFYIVVSLLLRFHLSIHDNNGNIQQIVYLATVNSRIKIEIVRHWLRLNMNWLEEAFWFWFRSSCGGIQPQLGRGRGGGLGWGGGGWIDGSCDPLALDSLFHWS